MVQSASRQILHIALPIFDPLRIDQALSFGVELLIGTADSSIADVRYLGNFLGGFAMAHQIRCHVYASGDNGERGTAGKIAHGSDTVR